MAEYVCDQCGQRNAYGTTFCASCGAYLAWDDSESSMLGRSQAAARHPAESVPGGSGSAGSGPAEAVPEEAQGTVLRPPPGGLATAGSRDGVRAPSSRLEQAVDPTEGLFRTDTEQTEVVVPVTGEPVPFAIRVTNTSDIVEGYVLEAPGAPGWLTVSSSEVRLLPGTDEPVAATLRITAPTLVPAQEFRLLLRLRTVSRPTAHLDLPLLVTVPVLDVPVTVRAEPRLLRLRDRDTIGCTVFVDNAGSNRAVRVQLLGSDPELAVQFRFEPAVLELGPGASASANLLVTAPGPDPGQEISRSLTVTAVEGARRVDTLITLQQATTLRTEDPPVTLEVEPSLVRARDARVAFARVNADNRGGAEWAHLQLKASDPERLVRVSWGQEQLHVPPGQTAHAEVRFEAPLPEPGTEVSRAVTVSASYGRRTSTATATFVQVASASPMTTLGVRIDPSVVRVRDADGAQVQVVLDNRRGATGVRLSLQGSDPERAVRFTFSSPVVDVGPGQMLAVPLTVEVRRPDPGQELTRQFSVSASDNHASVEGSGSLVQASSRSAMETLAVRLDPSVLRLGNHRRGALTVVVDNRNSVQPVEVSMHGDDPENVIRFAFSPAVLQIPAGQYGSSAVTVQLPRAPVGQEVNRPYVIAASDGRSGVQAEGTFIQSAATRRPVARALFTLLGGLTMVLSSVLFWVDDQRGLNLNAADFNLKVNAGGLENVVSLGLIIAGLGVLVILGLAGRSGRLTRLAAGFAILMVVALIVLAMISDVGLDSGLAVVLAGCIAAYIGGRLVPR